MDSPGIYKVTNLVTGDFYIGSAKNIRKRWNVHKCLLRQNKHYNKHFQSVWNKYKEENFEFVTLITCPVEYLIKAEQWFIDSLKPHYNKDVTAGSRLGTKHSEEAKEKQRQAKLKNPNRYWVGKKRTHSLENQRKAVSRPVIQKTLEGETIATFNSCKEAAIKLEFPKSMISKCCHPNYTNKTYGGFIFEYL